MKNAENFEKIKSYIADSMRVKQCLIQDHLLLNKIGEAIEVIVSAQKRGNRVIFAGNGGSAADAQHLGHPL